MKPVKCNDDRYSGLKSKPVKKLIARRKTLQRKHFTIVKQDSKCERVRTRENNNTTLEAEHGSESWISPENANEARPRFSMSIPSSKDIYKNENICLVRRLLEN